MAFNTAPGRAEYTASAAQTIFTFTFKIFNTSDVKVYLTPAGQTADDTADILIETTDYTISINGDNGGDVTLTSGATLNDGITLVRALPTDRDTEYQQNGDLTAEALNDDQDYQTYLILDGATVSERALTVPDSVQSFDTVLPSPGSDKMFIYSSDGKSIVLIDPSNTDFFKEAFIVNSMQALLGVDETTYGSVNVRGYYSIGDSGGDLFNWDSTVDKSTANPGTIIDPSVSLANQGTGVGFGCWVRQYDGVVNSYMFGLNSTSDGSVSLKYMIENFKVIEVNNAVKGNVEATASDVTIYGNGTIFFDTKVTQILKITGDNNRIEGISFKDTVADTSTLNRTNIGVHLLGNKNTIKNCLVEANSVPVSTNISDSYGRHGIFIEGDDNIVIENEVRYMGNAVYSLDGFRNTIESNYLHDCFVGVNVTSGECDTIIVNNHIHDCNIIDPSLPVLQHSGADGILCSTGSRRITISGNRIDNATEHGMYIQSIYSAITGNTVSNNGGSGIKLAGKEGPTINWNGETPVLKGSGGVYVGYSNVVNSNVTYDNGHTIASNAGIYLQGGLININVVGNKVNEVNCSGARTAYEAANPDLSVINITGNNIEGLSTGADYGLGANSLSDSLIAENLVTGNFIYGGDSSQKSTNIKVVNNKFTGVFIANNSDSCKIEGNEFSSFDKSNGTLITLQNNVISGQAANLNFNGVINFLHNDVTFTSNYYVDLAGSTCQNIIGNEFNSSYTTPDNAEIFFDYGFNAAIPVDVTIQGNTFNLPNWNRVARFGGSDSTILNNLISNDSAGAADSLCFDIQATQSDTLYSGNLFTNSAAGLNIRAGATNILVNNHMGAFVDSGTGTKTGLIK